MDSGEYHLLAAGLCKDSNLLQNILCLTASHTTSGIGDLAVGTKLITAILYLDVCSGMPGGTPKLHFLILVCMIDVQDRGFSQGLVPVFRLRPASFQVILQDLHDVLFSVIPHQKVDALILLCILFSGLNIAAHSDYHGLRILLFCAVKHLPALSVRYVCDSTGVNDINIGRTVKWYNCIPLILQFLLHNFQFVGIYLAAKVMKCNCFHAKLHSFLFCF